MCTTVSRFLALTTVDRERCVGEDRNPRSLVDFCGHQWMGVHEGVETTKEYEIQKCLLENNLSLIKVKPDRNRRTICDTLGLIQ